MRRVPARLPEIKPSICESEAVPRDQDQQAETTRRSVVPDAAGRSLWFAAVWTGVGAAVVCATVAVVVVSVLWLPVSSATHGRTSSAIHAGLLTFLASVHGGITVDGVSGHWLPLGMLIAVAVTAWRAGSGLADAATQLGDEDPMRLALAGAAQTLSFALAAVVVVPFAALGTSDAPFLGVGIGALGLFALTGGVAYIRSSALREQVGSVIDERLARAARAAAAAIACYLGFGAILMAGSLAIHHDRVETLSRQVGGGWGGVPILLLGILAAPNAAIAAASYLSGAGFAVGSGATVGLTQTAHGSLPAFPLLAAIPSGHGATTTVWVLAAVTMIGPGIALGVLACRVSGALARLEVAGLGALVVALAMGVLGWQSGGSIGSGRLATFGPSPIRLGLFTGVETGAGSLLVVGLVALVARLRGRGRAIHTDWDMDQPPAAGRLSVVNVAADDAAEGGRLAG
jgi:hypothetical protein